LFNNPNAKLEKFLGNLNGTFSTSHLEINEVASTYENEVYHPAKGIETFNSTEEEASDESE
jgi:hypothetical protein